MAYVVECVHDPTRERLLIIRRVDSYATLLHDTCASPPSHECVTPSRFCLGRTDFSWIKKFLGGRLPCFMPCGSCQRGNPEFAKLRRRISAGSEKDFGGRLDVWWHIVLHVVCWESISISISISIMNLQIRVLFLLSAFCLSWHPSHFNCSAAALVGDTEYGSIGQESEELDLFVIPSRGLKKSKGSKKAKSYKKSNSYDYRPIYQDSWNYESAYRPNRYSSSSSSSSDTRYSKSGKKGKKGKKSKGSKSYKRRPFIYKYKSFKKSKAFKKYPKNSFKRPERPEEPAEPTQTILEIAAETLDLSTLVSLLTSEGQEDLLETLKGEGPFTVFAPLNSAFDELFETVDPESLTDEEISNILAYHVVGSLIFEEDFIISESGIITAVNGDPIVFDVDDSEVTLNNEVLIVIADIIASNGVIHLVDKGEWELGTARNSGCFL